MKNMKFRTAKNVLFVLCLVLFQAKQPKVYALPECTDALLRDLQIAIINCTGQSKKQPQCSSALSAASPLVGGGNIYMLGDSITYGARSKYKAALEEKGVSVHINASGGRAWIWGGMPNATTDEGSNKSGRVAVDDDAEAIAAADGIVIALGTNGGLDANPIEEIIDKIRPLAKNTSVPIWWVNVAVSYETPPSSDSIRAGTFNTALEAAAPNKAFTIIDWLRTVNPSSTLNSNSVEDVKGYMGDSVHPNSTGQDALVGLVVQNLTGAPPAPTGCGGTTGSENQKFVFDYFVSEGYTPEQAAGIVGNMIHESGVEPMRLQATPPGEQTPSASLGSNATNNDIGWGLVQWTPPGKMVNAALEAGIANETIDTTLFQVQFLKEQLEGAGLGGGAANESAAGESLKSTTTVEEAAVVFAGYYERFRDSSRELPNGTRTLNLENPEYLERINSAIDVLGRYGSV